MPLDDFSGRINGSLDRRTFIKACTMMAAAMGLSESMVPKIVEAANSKQRPPVVWLHFQECTGCSEVLLRGTHPDLSRLILDIISLDYHETVMAASGHQAEEILQQTINEHEGNFLCVVEGSVPTKDNGIYCKIAGRTAMEILAEVAPKSAAIIAIGNCASFGNIQAARPNPTGAVGTDQIVTETRVINVSGCPPNPISFLGTILHYLTFNRLPATDQLKRPLFAYHRKIHDFCERRAHFDEGRFVEEYGDNGHKLGYCLYKVGCKGPATYNNCPAVRWNNVGTWPVGIGHGCVGCSEPDFWDNMSPFYERLPGIQLPFGGKGAVTGASDAGFKVLGITAAAVGIHAAVGIGKKLISGKKDQSDEE